MELLEAVKQRHSVRSYLDKPIEKEKVCQLEKYTDEINQESGLHVQLILNESEAFKNGMAHYGNFKGVNNYIALVGLKGKDLEEKCGYYGEKIVLFAQQLGLNTCWVALTFNKSKTKVEINTNEKLAVVISIGYGETQGVQHKSKNFEEVSYTVDAPDWYKMGVECALLAPTAVNQQKFTFALEENQVSVKAGLGFYTKMDLGIVKYHFEIGARKENFSWKK